jgi:hypothetical protein
VVHHVRCVERAFNKAEHWRAVATRYDKLAITYRAGVVLALIVEWLQSLGDTTQVMSLNRSARAATELTACISVLDEHEGAVRGTDGFKTYRPQGR